MVDAMDLFLAHAGHWLVQAVYFLPVVAFLVWLAVTQLKARREGPSDLDADQRE